MATSDSDDSSEYSTHERVQIPEAQETRLRDSHVARHAARAVRDIAATRLQFVQAGPGEGSKKLSPGYPTVV